MNLLKHLLSLTLLLVVFPVLGQEPFKIGIIKYKTEEKVMATFQPVAEYLENEIGRNVEIEIVPDSLLAYRLHTNKYDLGIFKPFEYMKAHETYDDLKVFGTHEVYGEDVYYGFILVRDDSPYKRVADLKGSNFLFIKENSTSGFSIPKGVFSEREIDIDTDLNYGFSYSHEVSLDSLMLGAVDGIAISSESFGKRSDVEFDGVRILSEVQIPYHGYVFSPDLDERTRDLVKRALFNAKRNPEAGSLFNNPLNITGWRAKEESYYNQLRRYFEMIRVKPTSSVHIDLAESAKKYLSERGDAITTIPANTARLFRLSDRFSTVIEEDVPADLHVHILLSLKDRQSGTFRFQVVVDNRELGSKELTYEYLEEYVPAFTTMYILKEMPISANVLSNGTEWFVSYGHNDGITSDTSYQVTRVSNPDDLITIKRITEMNTYIAGAGLEENEEVLIMYSAEEFEGKLQEAMADVDLTSVLLSDDNIWDKIGLFGGILVGVLTTGLGWYFNTRKKRKFKSLLMQTNGILQEFYEDQHKTEAKVLELKDKISQQLEDGQITENQFLICKGKIDEIEAKLKGESSKVVKE